VQSGPQFSGEEKGPGYPDGADGIQLVCIEEHFCFQCSRAVTPAEAMGGDAVDNVLPTFTTKGGLDQYFSGQDCTCLGVAALATSAVLVDTADVMQIRSGFGDQQIRSFGDTDTLTQAMDSQGMVPVVAPPGLREVAPGLFADTGQQGGRIIIR
jgi:hypothetical protein